MITNATIGKREPSDNLHSTKGSEFKTTPLACLQSWLETSIAEKALIYTENLIVI